MEDKSSRHSGELRRLDSPVIPRGPTHGVPVISWSARNYSCMEGKVMTWKTWVLRIASGLVSVILLEGQVCAAGGRKQIVVFQDGTPLAVQQQAVALSGSTGVLPLSFINAWAIELPDVGTANALAFLLNYTVLGVPIVVGVYPDL